MFKRDISKFNVKDKKERYAVQQVRDFIESDKALYGNILVIYGLRRTGKTTIMEQAISSYTNKKCAFYEIQDNDNFYDIQNTIIEEEKKGLEILCLDEVTKAEDFITHSSVLPDLFAKDGIRVIVTGTDSLSFIFADHRELYGRTYVINTTYISFAEHCKVLGTNDMDYYIKFGGLMCKGQNKKYVYDYFSALKYLDEAVSENIVNSLKKYNRDSCLEDLSKKELQTIIEKLVEIYSGNFNTKDIQNELKTVSVNYPIRHLNKIIGKEITRPITFQEREITRNFANKINADTEIITPITTQMVHELKNYLRDLNLVSVTSNIKFIYTTKEGWEIENPEQEYYIVQPAIKFNHLEKGKEFFEHAPYYKKLSNLEQDFLKLKLEEKIFGDMLEQIVLYDTYAALNFKLVRYDKNKYEVYKPSFIINGQNKGEYDMVVYDKNNYKYWGFEIKHTTMPFIAQEKHLQNEAFFPILELKFGHRENVCVLYRGEPFFSDGSDTIYLNVADFLCSINQTHNIEKTISDLTQNIPTKKIPTEDIPNPIEIEIIEQRKKFANTSITKMINNKQFNEAYKFYDEYYNDNILQEKNPDKELDFMKEVVKAHGTDTKTLNEAVNAVTDFKNESPAFTAKLMQDTLKTDEYKKAFEAGQGETAENTR